MKPSLGILFVWLWLIAGCDAGTKTPAPIGFDAYAFQFMERTHSLLPHRAVRFGRHEFDGVQTNYSATAIKARQTYYAQALIDLEQFELADTEQRYDRDLLHWFAAQRLFALQQAKLHQTNITSYFASISPRAYVGRDYAPPQERLAALVNHTRNLPNLIRQLQTNLVQPLPRPHIERALGFFAELVEYYEDEIPEKFALVDDVNLQQQLSDSSLGAVHAFRNALVWLQEQEKEQEQEQESIARSSFRLGDKLFQALLAQVHQTPMSLAEFKALGEADLARNLEALEQACAQFDPKLPLTTCVVEAAGHEPEMLVGPTGLLGSEEQSKGLRQLAAVFEPVSTQATDLRLAGAESTHQIRAFARSKGFTDGWVHYTENLTWEAGLRSGQPIARIQQLQNALLRNVQYLCSYGLHVEQLTLDACEQMFVKQALLSPGEARQQAVRGTYEPDYFSHTLHKLLIRQLRQTMVDAEAVTPANAWTAFHEQLLSLGAPPTPLATRYLTQLR